MPVRPDAAPRQNWCGSRRCGTLTARARAVTRSRVHSEELVPALRRTELFASADPDRLARLAARAFVRRFATGQVVFTEGEPSDHLYVVRTGRLRVLVTSPRGDELTLSVLGPGDTMGELSIIDGAARSASAEAVEATELLTLPAADVRAAFEADPALLLAVAGELAGIVRRLTGGTADLVFLDLPRRLAKLIVTESRQTRTGIIRVEVGMSQSGLAARLGVTRQSLNRALSGLTRRGWLSAAGGGYVVHDLAALQRFADS
jgi:CRP/FNR family cyclic AMP-dependent transcriptional regulator